MGGRIEHGPTSQRLPILVVALAALVCTEESVQESSNCSATLFTDGELGTSLTYPVTLEVTPGLHLVQDLIRKKGLSSEAVGTWISWGVASVIVSGPPGSCVLTLFEKEDLSGWKVELAIGRYTSCILQSSGMPPRPPRAVRLGSGPQPQSGTHIAHPPIKHRWHGLQRLAHGLASSRYFELSFQLEITRRQSIQTKICHSELSPILELHSSGLTLAGTYFNASHDEAVEAIGALYNLYDPPHVRAAMLRPLITLWLAPPALGIPPRQTFEDIIECRFLLHAEMANLPDTKPLECIGLDVEPVVLGTEPISIQVSHGHDQVMRVFANGQEQMACRMETSLTAQRNVDVFWGSRFYGKAAPAGLGATSIRYRLQGPRGPMTPFTGKVSTLGNAIPRIIHQVWLGEGEPKILLDSWQAHTVFAGSSDSWEHWLWRTEAEVTDMLFQGSDGLLADLLPLYEAETSNAGKSDFLRFALLYKFGGVYVDADSLWLGPPSSLDDVISGVSFAAAWESHAKVLVATGIMASVPGGAVVQRVLELQVQLFQHCRTDLQRKPWDPLALGTLTHVITTDFASDPSVHIWPNTAFYSIAHYRDPWMLRGTALPQILGEVPGAVSIDIGLSTNKFPSGSFAAGRIPHSPGSQADSFVSAWKRAVGAGIEVIGDALQDGSDFSYAALQSPLPPEALGARVAGFPRQHVLHSVSLETLQQLMVVAHADDEILFGSELLAEGSSWLIVIVAVPEGEQTQHEREVELLKALSHFSKVVEVRILGFPECSQCVPFHPSLYDDLSSLLSERSWERVVTHGSLGEYGHPQHRELHLVLAAFEAAHDKQQQRLWVFQPRLARDEIEQLERYQALEEYVSQRHILDVYRDWRPGAAPVVYFNVTQAVHMCRHGAGIIPYYLRTCASSEKLQFPASLQFLSLEAAALPLQPLARELTGIIDVGLFALPHLRRFLMGEAALALHRAKPRGLSCIAGSANALAWLSVSAEHRVRLLPLPSWNGRLLEDATSELLQQSFLASRVNGFSHGKPARSTFERAADCDVLIGPADLLLHLLSLQGIATWRAHWRLALYGAAESFPDVRKEDFTAQTVETSLASVLHEHKWHVIRRPRRPHGIACAIGSSWQRVWNWDKHAREPVMDRNAIATDNAACYVEVRTRAK